MIGAGTGLAPFRSFWQERKFEKSLPSDENNKKFGEMHLYFGCRQMNVDELYKDEILQMIDENVLTAYHPAFSRQPNMKKVLI